MTTRDRIVDSRFRHVDELLQARVDDGNERGASLCVIHDDEVLLDTWAGWTDTERTVPWKSDTITPVWSISKVMTNLAVLVLFDRGHIELDEPVATYWPEFGVAGKSGITIAQVLGHTSGVPAWTTAIGHHDLYDWNLSTADLAQQATWWQPGTASGYHLLNQGHLLGAVIERVTGLLPGEYLAQELSVPLDADFHIGLAAEHDHRVSVVSPPRILAQDPPDPNGIAFRVLTQPFVNIRESSTEQWRRGQIPAANGHGNARSVAEVQSVVSHGGSRGGKDFLRPSTVDRIFEVQSSGPDLVLGLDLTFGTGWALPRPQVMPSVPPGRRCYWGGLGGSVVVNDLDTRTTIAYVMNSMRFEYAPGTRVTRPCGDSRSDEYLAAIWKTLGVGDDG